MSRFLRVYLVHFVFALVLVTGAYSVGFEGGLSWDAVLNATGALFGGVWSLLGILAAVAVLVFVFWLVRLLARRNQNDQAAIVAVIGVIVAGFGWLRLVDLPSRSLLPLVALLLLVALETLVVNGVATAWISSIIARRPASAPAPATP